MSEKDDRLYLIHMLECIGRVEAYIGDEQTDFLAVQMVQDAVLRCKSWQSPRNGFRTT